jgi:hypothetical protein
MPRIGGALLQCPRFSGYELAICSQCNACRREERVIVASQLLMLQITNKFFDNPQRLIPNGKEVHVEGLARFCLHSRTSW